MIYRILDHGELIIYNDLGKDIFYFNKNREFWIKNEFNQYGKYISRETHDGYIINLINEI